MKKVAVTLQQEQEKVNAYFQSQSSFWKDIYTRSGVHAEIYRNRHAAILNWIDNLALARGSQVLEVGCGAGFMSIALAERGFRVRAIDSVEAMVEQGRRHTRESGTAELLSFDVGDAYALAFEDESFDLMIAIGVIPWLERPELALQEMARVTKPGGHVILTADNRLRLNILLDPWLNPALVPLRSRVKGVLEQIGLRRHSSGEMREVYHDFHSRRFIDDTLARFELVKTKSMTLGFGPFSLSRRTVIPEPLGTALHQRLQYLADRNVPGFRSTGSHYIVLARKSVPRSLMQSMNAEKPVSDATTAL